MLAPSCLLYCMISSMMNALEGECFCLREISPNIHKLLALLLLVFTSSFPFIYFLFYFTYFILVFAAFVYYFKNTISIFVRYNYLPEVVWLIHMLGGMWCKQKIRTVFFSCNWFLLIIKFLHFSNCLLNEKTKSGRIFIYTSNLSVTYWTHDLFWRNSQ